MTTSFSEIALDVDNGTVLLIDSTHPTVTNDYVNTKYEPSGIVLLSLISIERQYAGILEWDESHHRLMGKHKSNIIKGGVNTMGLLAINIHMITR